MSPWRLPWLVLGIVSAGCGILGVVLPLVPTTPFLLLSAYGFSRSSPRLHAWLIGHRRLGPPIQDWQAHRAIGRRAKLLAMGAVAAAFAVSLAAGVGWTMLFLQAAVLTAAGSFVLTRPSPPPARPQPQEAQ